LGFTTSYSALTSSSGAFSSAPVRKYPPTSDGRGFARRMDENFKAIMEKYEEISEKPTTILETLTRESRDKRSAQRDNEATKRGIREVFKITILHSTTPLLEAF
jgi:predicted lipid-binding transport protein (Tim44 family)